MCKLFAITNTKKLSLSQLDKIAKSVSKNMTSERDGFGITLKKQNNEVYVRRFLKPAQATIYPETKNYSFKKIVSNSEGYITDSCETSSVVFHGRTSTNSVSLINTHPIAKHGLYLSHNGVVEDLGPKYIRTTSNDTEHMVERLSQGIGAIEKNITGYYATMSYKSDSLELTIIKDNIASLFFAWLPSLDSFVFATTPELIKAVLKENKIGFEDLSEVEDNVHLKILGSEVLFQETITPKGRSNYADSLSGLSLGYDLKSFSSYDSSEDLRVNDFSMDEISFLSEVDQLVDHSWLIYQGSRELDLDKFFSLEDEDKLECILVRPDGTVLSMDESNEKLFDYSMIG